MACRRSKRHHLPGATALVGLAISLMATPAAAQAERPEAPFLLACAGHGLGMPCLGDTPDAPSATAWQDTLRRVYGAPTPTMTHDRNPFQASIDCANVRAELRGEPLPSGQVSVQLSTEASQWAMRKTVSLGGDRYEAESDLTTWVWLRDGTVALSLQGQPLAACKTSGQVMSEGTGRPGFGPRPWRSAQ